MSQENTVLMPEKENIEAPKLEWGPTYPRLNWDGAKIELAKLNKNLAKGEKPWRLPTIDELEAASAASVPGFDENGSYMSGTAHYLSSDPTYTGSHLAWYFEVKKHARHPGLSHHQGEARFVR